MGNLFTLSRIQTHALIVSIQWGLNIFSEVDENHPFTPFSPRTPLKSIIAEQSAIDDFFNSTIHFDGRGWKISGPSVPSEARREQTRER